MSPIQAVHAPSTDHFSACVYVDGVRLDYVHRRRVTAHRRLRLQLAIKRVFDVVLSLALLIFLAPLLCFCLLATKLTSQGPVIFFQDRWGLNETRFRCFKIRTMYVEGDPRRTIHLADGAEDGTLRKLKNDPRVTTVGTWLRRTSIDELPQLVNVLRGDMSMIGPRPLVLPMLNAFDTVRAARCAMRPGITGLWQIRNRGNNTHVRQMIADDSEYILNFSLLLDLRILCATPIEVCKGTGAH